MTMPELSFAAPEWLALFIHFASLSLLSVGGAITTAPDMHRYLVDQQHWLTDAQFNTSIAIAQAAPGPNVLFIALMGWNVGLNAGGFGTGMFGVLMAMGGILLPSTVLAYSTGRWSHRNRDRRAVRAFKQGMSPMVIGLLVSTGWILVTGSHYDLSQWRLWLLAAVATLLVWRTRLHLLWLLAGGALLGAVGLV